MKYLIGISLVIFLVILYFYWVSPAWIKCYWIKQSNFIHIEEKTYISPFIPKKLVPIIQQKIKEANQRLINFWGNKNAKPILIFCANEQEFIYFGSPKNNIPALTHMTAIGAFIVIQLDGISVDILAHELNHAELLERLGWFIKSREIPTWFDEGLALQLDYRYPFSTFEEKPPSVEDYQQECKKYTITYSIKTKNTPQKFYEQGSFTHINYLFAGSEIRNWLYKNKERKGLLNFIEKLKKGQKFEKAY
ncbi:MAG: hypothetical protein EAZ85_05015 [Bacteroidetes bacterium]|nr:MAG: hypothetical protein EAZ85_05015 [Bacteroidota bacterium]TAG85760.1 MAG: hypothetical protein EAZ20_14300 [Bacteroidota bacterium]